MAKALDMDFSQYSRQEKKGNKLTLEQIERIAEALGIRTIELLTWGEEQPSAVGDSVALAAELEQLKGRISELEELNEVRAERLRMGSLYVESGLVSSLILDFIDADHSKLSNVSAKRIRTFIRKTFIQNAHPLILTFNAIDRKRFIETVSELEYYPKYDPTMDEKYKKRMDSLFESIKPILLEEILSYPDEQLRLMNERIKIRSLTSTEPEVEAD